MDNPFTQVGLGRLQVAQISIDLCFCEFVERFLQQRLYLLKFVGALLCSGDLGDGNETEEQCKNSVGLGAKTCLSSTS